MVSHEEPDGGSELLVKLSTALALISKGDPIVSLRTELGTKFESIETRFTAIDKATDLVHDEYVRVPTQVDRSVNALKEVLQSHVECAINKLHGELTTNTTMISEKFNGSIDVVTEKINSLANVTTQQFISINDKFAEKDKAVSVGLSAQKESAAAQQDSNNTSTRKMEDNFTKLLDQGSELLKEVRRNTELQINDIKSRLDKGEGLSRGNYDNIVLRHSGNQNTIAMIALGVAVLGFVGWLYTAARPAPSAPSVMYIEPPGAALPKRNMIPERMSLGI